MLTPEELAAWVAASCAAQGVTVKVTDPTTIRRVGTLLTGAALSSTSSNGKGVKDDGEQT